MQRWSPPLQEQLGLKCVRFIDPETVFVEVLKDLLPAQAGCTSASQLLVPKPKHGAAQAAYEIVRKHDIINLIFEAWDHATLPASIGRMSVA